MLFAIVETHKGGVPLPRETILLTPPVVGQLAVSDWREGNRESRALRMAELKHPTVDYYPALLKPLFDPVLVRMTAAGFLLVGWQVEPETGAQQVKQGWWAVCTSKVDTPTTAR